MDLLIARANGDIDEYRRIRKFMNYHFNDSTPNGYTDIYEILDEFSVESRIFDFPWKKAKTKELRAQFLDEYSRYSSYGPIEWDYCDNKKLCPIEYAVALYEDEIQDIYDIAATIIQKHTRGVITRASHGVHNPHCKIGQAFLRRMFECT
tara:strand:+ start:12866 stop:13315 length:450 start_codon:yes stop_codon:yes gene_type:complete